MAVYVVEHWKNNIEDSTYGQHPLGKESSTESLDDKKDKQFLQEMELEASLPVPPTTTSNTKIKVEKQGEHRTCSTIECEEQLFLNSPAGKAYLPKRHPSWKRTKTEAPNIAQKDDLYHGKLLQHAGYAHLGAGPGDPAPYDP